MQEPHKSGQGSNNVNLCQQVHHYSSPQNKPSTLNSLESAVLEILGEKYIFVQHKIQVSYLLKK